jgi:prepilin-type N-terminal cleavage/methylation domain-containing protein
MGKFVTKIKNIPCKKGVTLIELVVALALSVLLVTTTSGVIKSMTQKKKVFADRLEIQHWRLELASRLRDDLCQSKEMRIGMKSLELIGFCGHDRVTGEPSQTPVYVLWQLKNEDGYHALIRTEKPHSGMEELTVTPQIELTAIGITTISIGTFAGREQEEKTEMATLTAKEQYNYNNESGEWTTIPKVLKLVVFGTKNEILVNELIFR